MEENKNVVSEFEIVDTEELNESELRELQNEAIEMRWSSKPTTGSKRCC